MLNDLLLQSGGLSWKPVLTALLLPPVPLLLLMLLGAALARRRAAWGWLLLLAGAAGIWLSSTTAVGQWLQRQLLQPSRALSLQDLQQLQAPRRDGARQPARSSCSAPGARAMRRSTARPTCRRCSMERLRYGLWLARETGAAGGLQRRHRACAGRTARPRPRWRR